MSNRYIALDSSPVKAIEARGKGLPVFYGEANKVFVTISYSQLKFYRMSSISKTYLALVTLTHVPLGDINRPEVLKNFDVGEAKACVFTIDDMAATNKVKRSLCFHFLPDVLLILIICPLASDSCLRPFFFQAVINVRKMYPKLPLLVRAKNTEHKKRLEKMFGKPYERTKLLVFIGFLYSNSIPLSLSSLQTIYM